MSDSDEEEFEASKPSNNLDNQVSGVHSDEKELSTTSSDDLNLPSLMVLTSISTDGVNTSTNEIKALPAYCFFISNAAFRALPYRDASGRINTHLLSFTRQQLSSGKVKIYSSTSRVKLDGSKVIIDIHLQRYIHKIFDIAFPGLPQVEIHEDISASAISDPGPSEGHSINDRKMALVLNDAKTLQEETKSLLKAINLGGSSEDGEVFKVDQSEDDSDSEQENNVENEELGLERRLKKLETKRNELGKKQQEELERRKSKGMELLNKLKIIKRINSQTMPDFAPLSSPTSKSPDVRELTNERMQINDENEEELLIIENGSPSPMNLRRNWRSTSNRDALKQRLHSDAVARAADEKAMRQGFKDFAHQLESMQNRCRIQEQLNAVLDDEQTDMAAEYEGEGLSSQADSLEAAAAYDCTDDTTQNLDIGVKDSLAADDENSQTAPKSGIIKTHPLFENKTTSEKNISDKERAEIYLHNNQDHRNVVVEANKQDEDKCKDRGLDVVQTIDDFKESDGEANEDTLSDNESEVGNEQYRALLMRENKLAKEKLKLKIRASGNEMFEEEASEDEEEDVEDDGKPQSKLNLFGRPVASPQKVTNAKLLETDFINEDYTKEDLDAIVDHVNEADSQLDANMQFHNDRVAEDEKRELEDLYRGIKQRNLLHQRRAKLRERAKHLMGAGVLHYLNDQALEDDESSDEELELAKEERYKQLDEQRRSDALEKLQERTFSKGNKSDIDFTEVTEIDLEIQQQKEFLEFVKNQKLEMKLKAIISNQANKIKRVHAQGHPPQKIKGNSVALDWDESDEKTSHEHEHDSEDEATNLRAQKIDGTKGLNRSLTLLSQQRIAATTGLKRQKSLDIPEDILRKKQRSKEKRSFRLKDDADLEIKTKTSGYIFKTVRK